MSTKGSKCWVTNGSEHKQINISELQQYLNSGYHRGQLPSKVDRSWYTNGIEDRHFINQPVPEGWRRGRTNCGKGTSGTVWINNGIKQTLIIKGAPLPQGYYFGQLPRSEEHNKKISLSLKGKIRSEQHCKALSLSHKKQSYFDKIETTMFNKYGVRNAFQLDWVIKRSTSEETLLKKRYSKQRNKTFNSSALEDKYYNEVLLKTYAESDIIRQYSTDSRYPYACDFYIKSEDLFIEINGFFTHGEHPFDVNSEEDNKLLEKLKQQSSWYSKATIDIWSKKDVEKLETAKRNSLNILIYYSMNIEEPKVINLNHNIKLAFNDGKIAETNDRVKHNGMMLAEEVEKLLQ